MSGWPSVIIPPAQARRSSPAAAIASDATGPTPVAHTMIEHPSIPSKPASWHERERLKLAYHEAGHVAAIFDGQEFYWLRGISLAPGRPGGGRHLDRAAHLTIEPPPQPLTLLGEQHRQQAEALLIIVLAGAAAERRFLGHRQRGRAFRQELASHDLYPLLHGHGTECLHEYRRWLQARAVQIVTSQWGGICRLAAALLERQDVSGQEAERLLRISC